MIKLTIFTPTYNRAYLLPALYESLKKQTDKNFIWLIIDDGSTDDTENIVSKWTKENNGFEITYIKKPNGGKHTAIDMSNKECKSPYIVCIDSDDYLAVDAVEKIYQEIEIIDSKPEVCGIVTRRVKPDGEPFSKNWTGEKSKVVNFYDLAQVYGYSADTCLVFKTDIIKQYHFPVFEDERFVTESVLYNQFMHDYKMLASDNLYYVAEYMPDGYTAQGSKLYLKNPKGYAYALKQNAYYSIKTNKSFKNKIAYSAYYYAWLKYTKLKKFKVEKYNLGFYGLIGNLLKFIPFRHWKKGE